MWLDEELRSQFGKAAQEKLIWREAATFDDQVLLLAAQRQHRAALLIRKRLRSRGFDAESVSHQLGWSMDRLGRRLRGEHWLDERELVALALALGAPEIVQPLLPEGQPKLTPLQRLEPRSTAGAPSRRPR